MEDIIMKEKGGDHHERDTPERGKLSSPLNPEAGLQQ
jgi:hypothetical protein